MSEQLLPASFAAELRAIERRLHTLETTARVGLSRIQTAEVAGPDTGPALGLDTFGNLSAGPGPAVTCTTGKSALVLGSAVISLGPTATYRNLGAKISFDVSGATTIAPTFLSTDGELIFSPTPADLTGYSLLATATFVDIVTTLNPGSNIFTMKFMYTAAGSGAASTAFRNMSLVVVPLDL